MKLITSINKIILFIFPFSCFSSSDIKYYLNNNEFFNRDIDIDNDGVVDKVISSINGFGDDLFFFKKNKNNYELIFKGSNFSEDGGARINDIKKSKDKEYPVLITTNTDKLNIMNSYYIAYNNKKWILEKINTEVSGFIEDYSKKYICKFDELNLDISIPDIKDKLPNYDLSDEYIRSNCELDYFFEDSLNNFIKRFNENNINIINGIESYRKLLLIYPYSDSTKKEYSIILNELSKLKLINEKNYLENIITRRVSNTSRVINKSYLYSSIGVRSDMYLIKGDRVHILEERIDEHGIKWFFINYKGKKEINMWIKADSVDLN